MAYARVQTGEQHGWWQRGDGHAESRRPALQHRGATHTFAKSEGQVTSNRASKCQSIVLLLGLCDLLVPC